MAAGKSQSPNGKRDPLHGLSPAQKKKIIMKRLGKNYKEEDGVGENSPEKMSYQKKQIQDRLLGMHNLVKEIEGNADELQIDIKNFEEDINTMDNEKKVEVPGIKIRNHLDTWEKEIPITNEEEINYFAVSVILQCPYRMSYG